jgi:hypothetical protein
VAAATPLGELGVHEGDDRRQTPNAHARAQKRWQPCEDEEARCHAHGHAAVDRKRKRKKNIFVICDMICDV